MSSTALRAGFLSLVLGCAGQLLVGCSRSEHAPGGVTGSVEHAPNAEVPASAVLSTGPSFVQSLTLDGGAGDAGPNCTGAGDPAMGIDARDAGSSCTGILGQATFQWAVCACNGILSGPLTTDGFNSALGPPDGGIGGNVGANGNVTWSGAASIGGNLWTPGNTTESAASVVRGNLEVGGTVSASAALTVDGNAYAVKTLPANVKVLGTVSHPSSVAAPCNCGNPVPIDSIVAANSASNNDNASIGLSATAAEGSGPGHITLPCGNYYLAAITTSEPLTIEATGHTALYVGGNVTASGALVFQVDTGATLDLFVEGNVSGSGSLTLGSTTAPASCRAYIAGSSLTLSGSSSIGCNVYAPNAALDPSGALTVYGSLFVSSLTSSGSTTVHFDTSILNVGSQCCTASTCDDGNPCTVDSCNGDGTCNHTSASNGTTCTGTNLCDQTYTCQAGVCTGSNPVACTALDQCHVTGTCSPGTGQCSNPTITDGTTCTGTNLCDQTYACESGTCTGSNPVTCTASDQCHVAGTCNPSTGACSNPTVANGTACTGTNLCDQAYACESGTCTGSNPVICTASDQCHAAGTCNPSTGTCSNPTATDGTACNDGNACTLVDACVSGTCLGSSPVVCNASDQCHVAGTCSPSTGACSNPAASNGTACNDGNACTQTDTCQSGTCAGSNPVTCTASDQCHVAGTCNPSTGACSNPTAANGTTCTGTNLCEQTYACESGACTGSNPVTCTASDQCHVAGTCSPSTGTCSNPAAASGTSCNDGNACTTNDACTAGACGGTAVTCTASDQCHAAGTCSASTGQCSNPALANGTSCNDGNACTTSDSCTAGVCAGTAVTCTASDQCHVAGTCNSSTGVCSNPTATNGTTCNDGNACTTGDSCQSGTCAGSAVTCTASDQCHVAGTCNPGTGTCSNPTITDGTTCTGANLCDQTNVCLTGTCTGSNPVTCTALDQCHVAGTCNPSSGTCSNPTVADGTACTGTNPCDQTYACTGGSCTGSNPIVCAALDPCHVAGTCDPTSGSCSNPAIADGTSCNDGNACTQTDACLSGTCTGSNPVTCTASGQCHVAGTCNPSTGTCSNPTAPDGTSCVSGNACTTGDTCAGGTCEPGVPIAVPESTACTLATCDPVTGTLHQANCTPLNRTVSTTLAAATSFLYTGANPIQEGVDGGTIAPSTAAVIRGHVYSVNGSGMPGVTVAVVNHPEFGSTVTQADGGFDLAVNGGQTLRLNYSLATYLTAQRLVKVPWQDYATADDVVLLQVDPNMTSVEVSETNAPQIARGSVITDSSGTRQATLLVPASTQATMTLANGTTTTPTTLSFRATEFTVGNSGPSAMPAELPPQSAYTYAVALTADEALAAGATSVTFSQPLAFYLDNFIGFPVGTAVPTGYYDFSMGAWVPSTNGVVLQILSVTGGSASLDVTGGGVAATSSALAALGISAEEQVQLATLYPAGKTLWRVPITHFTDFDNNWGEDPGDGGVPPNPNPPLPNGPGPNPCDDDAGSTIGCQRQALGENLPVGGTPYSLVYESDRQVGRQPEVDLGLSGATIPAPLRAISLQVSVAGNEFTELFPAQANQKTTFTWNGQDAYGRLTQGLQPTTITIGNIYRGLYCQLPRFAADCTGVSLAEEVRTSLTLEANVYTTMGIWDARPQGLGGWDLNIHHVFDVTGHVVHFGDGSDLTLTSLPGVIQTFAGTGGNSQNVFETNDGNGAPATSALVSFPESVAVGPDGSIYVGEGDYCVRRVTPDGVIHTFAGLCQVEGRGTNPPGSGDGGPATSAGLNAPYGLAFGPDGSLYIADRGDHRIRRVNPSGIITTVAGTGVAGYSGDGGPATQATINFPYGVDVAPDGTIFIADTNNCVVRQVSTAGIISTVAGYHDASYGDGCNFFGSAGTNGPATSATLMSPRSVRVAQDGGFYIAENTGGSSTGWVRKVGGDGIIRPFLGTGNSASNPPATGGTAATTPIGAPIGIGLGRDGSVYVADTTLNVVWAVTPDLNARIVAGVPFKSGFGGDNGPAAAATLASGPQGLGVGPDGTLYIADYGNNRVRAVGAGLPGFSGSSANFSFASKDGAQVYTFDPTGRHLQTQNAYTQAVLYSFSYDSGGRLASIVDVDGNLTQIAHDPSGNPTNIVGPYGGETMLTVDGHGYLASITDPTSETTQCTYSSTGLMATMTDARGGLHQFTYDSLGRLQEDQDPAGGSKTLTRTEFTNGGTGFSVEIATALGRETTLGTSVSTTGSFSRNNTFSDGTQASVQFGANEVTTTTVPDGTTTTESDSPDPRFGMLAPVASTTTKTPSGLTLSQTVARAVTLASGSLATETETTNINGNTWTRAFNASTKTWTTTSPAGRTSTMIIDAAGRPTQTAVPNVAPFTFAYDSHGRLVSTTQGSRVWTESYDANGFLASATDPMNHTISFTNDLIGRPNVTTFADGRLLGTTYDGDSNTTSLTLPSTEVHDFSYTPVDLLASYTPPSLSSASPATQYTYDVDRELTTMTRPDGIAVTYSYDSAGRLQATTLPQGTLTRTYNPTTGLLASLLAPSGESTAYTYDGFLRTGTTWSGPVAGTLTLGFDNNFRVTSQSVNGTALSFGYDADGLLTTAASLTLTLDPHNGRLTGTMLGAVTNAYSYDTNGLFATYVASYSGSAIYTESVLRDLDGRITQKTETIGSTTHVWGYTYDANGRLTDVTEDGNFASHYAYDVDDNRTTFTNTSGTVNPTYDAQDRLLTYGSVTYTYTANGELTSKTNGAGTTSYAYDPLGNLLGVGLPSKAIAYVVDGENRRVGKQVGGSLTTGYLYKDALNVVVQLDGSGNVVNRFVFGSKPNVPDYFTSSAGTFRILSDHLGSPRLIVNTSTGATVEEIDYDEFGNVTNDTSPGLTPFGFAGGLYDKDTGLVRFGARDYDASVGRWTSKDPIRFDGGSFNLYGYVVNDPIDLTDPVGTGPNCNLAQSFANEPRGQYGQCQYSCGTAEICTRENVCGEKFTCDVTIGSDGQHHLNCPRDPNNACSQAASNKKDACKHDNGCGPKPKSSCEPGQPDDGEEY